MNTPKIGLPTDRRNKASAASNVLARSPRAAGKGTGIQYRKLLQGAPDAIVVVDRANKIILVNEQAEKLFGYRRNELIGQTADMLIAEHSRDQHTHEHARFLAIGSDRPAVAGLELFGLRKDHTEFPAEIRLSPIDTREGVLVSSAIRDISDRRRTEEDLRRLASIVACSDDAIIGKTLEGIITSWNYGAERMYGYSAKEAIGQSIRMLVPADRPDEVAAVLERLKRGEIVDHFETVRVRRDGRQFHVELTASPIRDAAEQIVGASIVGRDITERKRREEAQAWLAAVVESSHDAIIGRTVDGVVTHWNAGAQRIFGYSAAEIIGTSSKVLFAKDAKTDLAPLMARIELGEWVETSDDIRVGQDGKIVHVAMVHAPIKNGADQVVGISTVARDVTAARSLEDKYRHSQKMEAVGRLAGGVAHDFNNLLGVILGYTELTLDRLPLDDLQRKDLEEIQKAGNRAALLTRQLLAFSRKQVLQPKVLDLNAVVAGTEELLHRLIGESVQLSIVLNPKVRRILADSGQLEQILMNLVVNARDAMPEGGKLTIETSNVELDSTYTSQHISTNAGPHVMLAVTDTGCGMTEEVQSHIFEPFFTTKEFGKGTGLGLATVYGIVKQSGASVWVYSEVGVGTTFKVYFPIVEALVEVEAPRVNIESRNEAAQTILVVEDDAALLRVTQLSLEKAGYETLAAANAASAVEISEYYTGPIHLMVTDVVMQGMSGPQLATHFSALRPEMKVLHVSGYPDDAVLHHRVLDPGLAFLQKPFSPKVLVQKVREVLGSGSPVAVNALREN